MKTLSVIFLLFAFATSVFAGQDSLFVEIKGDTVKIWNTDVYINCCYNLRFDVSIAIDSINIIQLDTGKDWCTCMCTFDLCTSITGLTPGTYYVYVYRYLPYADSIFVGMVSFTIINPGSSTFSTAGYQSECKVAVSVPDDKPDVPMQFTVWQNYPNPFNPVTTIRYQLAYVGRDAISTYNVTLKIYNLLGQEVATLVEKKRDAGSYQVIWNATCFPSGVYFYRLVVSPSNPLKIANQIKTGKMSLIR